MWSHGLASSKARAMVTAASLVLLSSAWSRLVVVGEVLGLRNGL